MPASGDELAAHWPFDEGAGGETLEAVSGRRSPIRCGFMRPEWGPGVSGTALRFDGFSTWIEHPLPPDRQPEMELTVSAWIAVPAYPVHDAALLARSTPGRAGFTFGIDRFGRLFLSLAAGDEWVTCRAAVSLPKYRWVHVAASRHCDGRIRCFVDGRLAAAIDGPEGPISPAPHGIVVIGRDPDAPVHARIFPTGGFNGWIDELRLHRVVLPDEMIRQSARRRAPAPDLTVPRSRFAADPHRPRYHPIPDGNWTNEPHGLVQHRGVTHLFYQKNPSGPYWSRIHWGHMRSRDLVSWTEDRIALVPEPGTDQEGIWSGCCVLDDGVPTAVYTGVDGVRAGVCLATSGDGMRTWRKHPKNPVVASPLPGFLDFRDPYVWRDGAEWIMLIGSGVPEKGGTALLYRSPNLVDWRYLGPILPAVPDRAGVFWEMPVLLPLGDEYLLYVTTVESGRPARALYWIGAWRDDAFTPRDPDPRPFDLIPGMLSPAMLPVAVDDVLAIGIVPEARRSEEQLRAGWAHVFSLPRLLSLSRDGTLLQRPHLALERLRGERRVMGDRLVEPGYSAMDGWEGEQVEIAIEIDPGMARRVGLAVRRSPLGEEETLLLYDAGERRFLIDRSSSSQNPRVDRSLLSGPLEIRPGETLPLRLFLDRSVIEGFVNGRDAFTARIYPTRDDSREIGLVADGGTAHLLRMEMWDMHVP